MQFRRLKATRAPSVPVIDTERDNLIGQNGQVAVELSQLPPKWCGPWTFRARSSLTPFPGR